MRKGGCDVNVDVHNQFDHYTFQTLLARPWRFDESIPGHLQHRHVRAHHTIIARLFVSDLMKLLKKSFDPCVCTSTFFSCHPTDRTDTGSLGDGSQGGLSIGRPSFEI